MCKYFKFIYFLLIFLTILPPITASNNEIKSVSIIFVIPSKIATSYQQGGSFSGHIIVKNNYNSSIVVEILYNTNPYCENITLETSQNNTIVRPLSSVVISILIRIYPKTVPGEYNLGIIVRIKKSRNVLEGVIKNVKILIIGGKIYKIRIKIRDSTGNPLTMLVYLYYLADNDKHFWSKSYGYDITFYVVPGEYLIEFYLGGELKNATVIAVSKNLTMEFFFSYLKIENVQIIRNITDPNDALVISFDIVSENPYLFSKKILIKVAISDGENEFGENVSTIVITGETRIHLTIAVLPKTKWKSGNYTISIIAQELYGNIIAKREIPLYIQLPEKKPIEFISDMLKLALSGIFGFTLALTIFKLRIPRAKISGAYILQPGAIPLCLIRPDGTINVKIDDAIGDLQALGSQIIPLLRANAAIEQRLKLSINPIVYKILSDHFLRKFDADLMLVVPYKIPSSLWKLYGKIGSILVFGKGNPTKFIEIAYNFIKPYVEAIEKILDEHKELAFIRPELTASELEKLVKNK